MSPDGKAQARVAAQKYLARSQTNLSGGLLMALDMLRRVPNPNDVSAVLLLTDGLANVGITKPDAIVKASAGLCGQIKSICSVFTFGFGREPDPQLLQGISNTSNGMYYFIDSPNAIAPAFGDAIGGLLSVVAQRLSLTIEADKGIIIKQIKTGYRVVSEVHEKRYRVEMDDLYSEERKDIICYIVTDKLSEEKPEQSLVEFTIRYKNLIDNTDQWKSATATMSRPLAAPASAQRQNREVSKQLNRIVAADAMSSALEYGMRNEYEKAQEVLRQASRQIHSSESRDDEYSVALSRQLEEETRRVGNEQSFSTEARRSLTSGARSHQQQRSSSTMSLYTTTQKSKSSSTATSFLSSG
jgi:Ca-activated chloride channel family protein